MNSLWALFNSGLAIAIILYARSKFYQRRDEFRILDAVPVFFALRATGNGRCAGSPRRTTRRKPACRSSRVGAIPAGPRSRARDHAPAQDARRQRGASMHEKTAAAGGDVIARAGVAVTGPSGEVDVMSRYLHESAVSKFLAEYSTRYRTYIESRLAPSRSARRARDASARTCRPSSGAGGERRFVRRDPEHLGDGYLLAAREDLAEGDRVTSKWSSETGTSRCRGSSCGSCAIARRIFPSASRASCSTKRTSTR